MKAQHKLKILIFILFLGMVFFFGFTNNAYALDLTAASLSSVDIQTAIDSVYAAGGGTVYLPAGTATWNGSEKIKGKGGVSLIGAGQEVTIITNLHIYYEIASYRPAAGFRISGFTGTYSQRASGAGGSFINIKSSTGGVRVDHVTMRINGSTAIGFNECTGAVVDHCHISGSNYGVGITGDHLSYSEGWIQNVYTLLGSPNAIFVEDNYFDDGTHHTVGHGNAHYVARYNTFDQGTVDGHKVDAHGPGYGPPCGTRLIEVYNNNFIGNGSDWKAVAIRGGAAVIFNNKVRGFDSFVLMDIDTGTTGDTYPLAMQPKDIWIWDNDWISNNSASCTCNYVPNMVASHCCYEMVWQINGHNYKPISDWIIKDRDFFLRAPSQALDGFTYAPYIYPHPLITDCNKHPITCDKTVIPPDCTIFGDVTCDQQVNSADIQTAINIFLGINNDENQKIRADLNKDSEVNVLDIQKIINIVLGV